MRKKIKAIGMVSGGLDSTLATAMMLEQGIEVLGVNFSTGFCKMDHHRQIQDPRRSEKNTRHEALRLGGDLGVPVKIIDISGEYMKIILHPKYGYGKNVNPCVDCRLFMTQKAGEYMRQVGAEFVFTGEVLGQRPKSQRHHPMKIISRESGLDGRLLRPLSARLLSPTIPEEMGWVKRDELGALHGRSRKGQMTLVEKYGINDYPQPAGGCCFLTEKAFAARFTDIIKFPLPELPPTPESMVLLKTGRHFRIAPDAKCIVGHDQYENQFLERIGKEHIKLRADMVATPVTIFLGTDSEKNIRKAAKITARYSDGRTDISVDILIEYPGEKKEKIAVKPMPPEESKKYLL